MTNKELAALIRKGAQLRPQHYGCAQQVGDGDVDGKSCAIGAAEEASTGIYPSLGLPSADFWSVVDGCVGSQISNELWRMNDYKRMTREQIADWLDTLDKPVDKQTFDDFMKATLRHVELEKPVSSLITEAHK